MKYRYNGELISFECGKQDSKTLKIMVKCLEKFYVSLYFADGWQEYAQLIPSAKLIQTKKETCGKILFA